MALLPQFIAAFPASPLGFLVGREPWSLTSEAEATVSDLLDHLPPDFRRDGDVAVHRAATVESGAVVKGPAIVGKNCFIAAGAYLRGGVWLDENCILGPGAEIKSSFMFAGSKLAHFNFVGDSILGSGVNLEAGSIVANYRNERDSKEIRARIDGVLVRTGVQKFGSLIGDQARIGANAVLAPGTLLKPYQVVTRLSLIDQEVSATAF